ncbi:hypothetical protein AVEN_147438-1 [Araneus ventricosus]|uniref:Uncharacterized protein n=1 Tax=Araneus ventricosus TaxID=182803 RepID=A0A4Y2PMR1_ARAVE|nr:hypothetical protein AVEN_147438-1 [Araneus ventricosus]
MQEIRQKKAKQVCDLPAQLCYRNVVKKSAVTSRRDVALRMRRLRKQLTGTATLFSIAGSIPLEEGSGGRAHSCQCAFCRVVHWLRGKLE